MRTPLLRRPVTLVLLLYLLAAACASTGSRRQDPGDVQRHRWWEGLGPVIPHDSFPADCTLCHAGSSWTELQADFEFAHEQETGVALNGAHAEAKCLRCHNDRGPVADFQAQGCIGCHEDIHQGDLGTRCTQCHGEQTWRPINQIALHQNTRFPLTGAHVAVACYRCHPGNFVGNFIPADPECVTCHQRDVQATTNPPHLQLGWTDRCDRCHLPTSWRQGSVR